MTQTELGSILKSIDTALEVYRRHEGSLTATEVSMKSMLTTLRAKVVEELDHEYQLEKIQIEPV
jgi:hypothetical protein